MDREVTSIAGNTATLRAHSGAVCPNVDPSLHSKVPSRARIYLRVGLPVAPTCADIRTSQWLPDVLIRVPSALLDSHLSFSLTTYVI